MSEFDPNLPGDPNPNEDHNAAGRNDVSDNGFDPNLAEAGSEVASNPEQFAAANQEQQQAPAADPAPAAPAAPVNAELRKEPLGAGMRDATLGGLSLTDEQLATKQKLANEPKMQIFVPLDPGEKRGAYRSVTINGYRFEIKKGTQVLVPESVGRLIMSAYEIEAAVLNDNEYNLNNDNEGDRRAALNA